MTRLTPHWTLEPKLARLAHPRLAVAVELARPELGLDAVSIDHRAFAANLLAVDIQSPNEGGATAIDAWTRGGDVVVTYEQTAARPFRVQVYWRRETCEDGPPAVDLQVSVQTSLLDILAQLTSSSRLPAGQLLRANAAGGFTSLDDMPAGDGEFSSADGPSLFVHRPAGEAWSYVEMTHAVDFHRELVVRAASEPAFTLRHWLFAALLEKGVILRARVRGLFVPRHEDLELASREYERFTAAPLPLTT